MGPIDSNGDDIATLLARVALRDRAAFVDLYDRSSAKLFGVCLRLLKSRPEAEEALQDVYVKIWHGAARFAEHGGSPMGWLVAVTRNHAIDLLRARKAPSEDVAARVDLPDPAPDPESAAADGESLHRVERCLAQLARDKAQAVRAAYLEGYSYQELAARHGVPLNTMRTWLRRSLMALRKCLESDDEVDA